MFHRRTSRLVTMDSVCKSHRAFQPLCESTSRYSTFGILISNELVLVPWHCVNNAVSIRLSSVHFHSQIVNVEIVAASPSVDLALVRIYNSNILIDPLYPSTELPALGEHLTTGVDATDRCRMLSYVYDRALHFLDFSLYGCIEVNNSLECAFIPVYSNDGEWIGVLSSRGSDSDDAAETRTRYFINSLEIKYLIDWHLLSTGESLGSVRSLAIARRPNLPCIVAADRGNSWNGSSHGATIVSMWKSDLPLDTSDIVEEIDDLHVSDSATIRTPSGSVIDFRAQIMRAAARNQHTIDIKVRRNGVLLAKSIAIPNIITEYGLCYAYAYPITCEFMDLVFFDITQDDLDAVDPHWIAYLVKSGSQLIPHCHPEQTHHRQRSSIVAATPRIDLRHAGSGWGRLRPAMHLIEINDCQVYDTRDVFKMISAVTLGDTVSMLFSDIDIGCIKYRKSHEPRLRDGSC